MKALFVCLLLMLVNVHEITSAEPYKNRTQKQEFIEEHGGKRHETGVRTRTEQIEFGTTRDYQEAFDRAKRNAGTNKPAVVITGPAHKMHRIRSEARKQGVELIEE